MSAVHQVEWLSWWAIINNSSTEREKNNNTEIENLYNLNAKHMSTREGRGMKLINFLPFFRFLHMMLMMMIRMWDKFTKQFSHFLCAAGPSFPFPMKLCEKMGFKVHTLCNSMLLPVYVYACISESPMMRREKINQKGIKVKRRWSLSLSGIFIMWIKKFELLRLTLEKREDPFVFKFSVSTHRRAIKSRNFFLYILCKWLCYSSFSWRSIC